MILEIATKEYPYTECVNQAQIYRKVTTGVKPAALNNVVDPETLQIIQLCLEHDPKIRPSAVDLLDHPFFSIVNTNPDGMPSMHSNESLSHREPKAHERMPSDISEAAVPVATKVDAPNHTYFIMERRASSLERTSTSTCTVISTLGITADEVTLTMVYNTGHAAQEIKFPFDLSQDTATDVVSELVDGKLINAEDDQLVRRKIEEAVRSILIRQRANDSNIPVEVDNIEPEARVVLLPGSNIVEEKISPKRPATSSPVYISAQPAQEPLHVPLHIPVPIGIPPKETANFADFHTFSPMLIPDAWESDLDARLRALQEINLLGFDNSNARPKSVGKSSSSLPNGSATHITGNSITGSLSASPTHFEFPPSESISSPPAK